MEKITRLHFFLLWSTALLKAPLTRWSCKRRALKCSIIVVIVVNVIVFNVIVANDIVVNVIVVNCWSCKRRALKSSINLIGSTTLSFKMFSHQQHQTLRHCHCVC